MKHLPLHVPASYSKVTWCNPAPAACRHAKQLYTKRSWSPCCAVSVSSVPHALPNAQTLMGDQVHVASLAASMDHSAWIILHGSFCMDHCSMDHCAWIILHGSFCMDHSAWIILHGSFCMDHSAWIILHGSFCMDHCSMDHSAWIIAAWTILHAEQGDTCAHERQ